MTIGLNFKKFDLKYRELVESAILHMQYVVASPIFMEILKDEISKSNGLEGELSMWKEALPEEIYEALFPITLYLSTYYSFRNVIGYGTPDTKEIFLNTKYLDNYSMKLEDLMMIGSNLLHEHSHDCGFDHDFYNTARRRNSLSYILNRAYERAFRKFYGVPEPIARVPWWRRIFS
jgi:hypothetical protein